MTAPAPPAMSEERLAQIEWSLAYAEKRQGLMTTFDVRDLLVEVKRLRAAPPGVVVAEEHVEDLARSASMLRQWAPEIFPEINEHGQKHFGRVMMEAVAETIDAALKKDPAP